MLLPLPPPSRLAPPRGDGVRWFGLTDRLRAASRVASGDRAATTAGLVGVARSPPWAGEWAGLRGNACEPPPCSRSCVRSAATAGTGTTAAGLRDRRTEPSTGFRGSSSDAGTSNTLSSPGSGSSESLPATVAGCGDPSWPPVARSHHGCPSAAAALLPPFAAAGDCWLPAGRGWLRCGGEGFPPLARRASDGNAASTGSTVSSPSPLPSLPPGVALPVPCTRGLALLAVGAVDTGLVLGVTSPLALAAWRSCHTHTHTQPHAHTTTRHHVSREQRCNTRALCSRQCRRKQPTSKSTSRSATIAMRACLDLSRAVCHTAT